MTDHKTGTREEWLAARLELLEAEKALTRRSDELARKRQDLPWVRIDKEYRFETDEGSASLADLFRGRSQLLVYHFMFGPEYTAGCPSCSAIADGFDGFVVHLANHDVTLSAVSRAPLAKLQADKRRMGGAVSWGIGRASGRGRGEISGGAGSLKKKKKAEGVGKKKKQSKGNITYMWQNQRRIRYRACEPKSATWRSKESTVMREEKLRQHARSRER